jgi:hypothetical protein
MAHWRSMSRLWPAREVPLAEEPRVRLLEQPRRPPDSVAERQVVAWLSREGPLPLARLVERVARELYDDELRRGGWASDIGIAGNALFRADAELTLQRASGVLWSIERDRDVPVAGRS